MGLSPILSGLLGLWRTLEDRPLGATRPRLPQKSAKNAPRNRRDTCGLYGSNCTTSDPGNGYDPRPRRRSSAGRAPAW
jgi:hypothetical protein